MTSHILRNIFLEVGDAIVCHLKRCSFLRKVSLNGGFMESFIALNIINFADMASKENDIVSWDVKGVSSP